MTEQGPVAIRKHGGHPKSSFAQSLVPIRVDAAVQGMQSPGSNSRVDGSASQSMGDKLSTRHDPMLARGEIR
jgi:hypothetical protein